jgi:hypothetical protein
VSIPTDHGELRETVRARYAAAATEECGRTDAASAPAGDWARRRRPRSRRGTSPLGESLDSGSTRGETRTLDLSIMSAAL